MPTANPLVCTPNPVPAGVTGEIDVTFMLASGTPDVAALVTLTKDGQTINSGSVLLKGMPGEVPPSVSIGQTGVGWELQTSAGTLTATGFNKFGIHG